MVRPQNPPAVLAPAAWALGTYLSSISQLERAVDALCELAMVTFVGHPSKLEVEPPGRSLRLHGHQSRARATARRTRSPSSRGGGRLALASSPPRCSAPRPGAPNVNSRAGCSSAVATKVKAAALSAGTCPTSSVRSKRAPTPIAAITAGWRTLVDQPGR